MTIEIKTEKFEGLLVKAPEGTNEFCIEGEYLFTGPSNNNNWDLHGRIKLPEGKWEIIGNPFELTDELLPILPETYTGRRYTQWMDILKSLQVYKENPYGEEPTLINFVCRSWGKTVFKKKWKMWLEAEERTGNWILLEKL